MKFGWKMRVGLVLSAIWLCVVFLVAEERSSVWQVLGIGLLPLVFVWGIIWSVSGWRSQRPAKPEASAADELATKRRRNLRLRTAFAAVAIIGLGLFSATWQADAANNEGLDIARWFGEWLAYGLFAYVVLRFTPKVPPSLAIALASLVTAVGVNYKTHSVIALKRQGIDSLAKAAPLIIKMQSGAAVNDQDVLEAKTGLFEPFLLASATYFRDVLAIESEYQKAIDALDLGSVMTPISLASADSRASSRIKLQLLHKATAEYKTKVELVAGRARLGMTAAQSQTPTEMSDALMRGFDESTEQLSRHLNELVASEREINTAVTATLDLMDAHQGKYAFVKGPPANLIFSDEELLGKYRLLVNDIMDASQRATDLQNRLAELQSSKTDHLTKLLKR